MEIHPFAVAFSFWRKTEASVEIDGKIYLKWKRLAPRHHRMLRMAWFAPMPSLAHRIPSGPQNHPFALLPGLGASHRCWHIAEAPAVKTCHTGWAASILLSLTDISGFAPDSHGAADGGIHRLLSCFFGQCVSFFQGDSLALNSAFKLKPTTGYAVSAPDLFTCSDPAELTSTAFTF